MESRSRPKKEILAIFYRRIEPGREIENPKWMARKGEKENGERVEEEVL